MTNECAQNFHDLYMHIQIIFGDTFQRQNYADADFDGGFGAFYQLTIFGDLGYFLCT